MMKYFAILFLGSSILFSLALTTQHIDYNPKILHKELSKLLQTKEYSITEVHNQMLYGGKLFRIQSANTPTKLLYIGRVKTCKSTGCNIQQTNTGQDHEFFDYFIVFNSQKNVEMVRVYNYESSYGFGITAKSWLQQFIGYNSSKTLEVGKTIDAIAGATISVHAITQDLQEKTKMISDIEM